MILTLDLPPELEARLRDEATRRGVQVDEYALEILQSALQRQSVGAHIIGEWERGGVIGCRPDITDSQAHSRMLRERAQSRARD